MTSKENLEVVIIEYKKELEEDLNNQWIKNRIIGLENCLKDLEVLEILKKNAKVIDYDLGIEDIGIYIYEENDNYEKVKEWLNDK